jgi:hypothetical protein
VLLIFPKSHKKNKKIFEKGLTDWNKKSILKLQDKESENQKGNGSPEHPWQRR